jgi:predicted Rossmann fold nucleotide-binding protein DprA/Smf involved in DNA uptake
MTTNKTEAKKRTKMLVALRQQHRDSVKQVQTLLKEQQTVRKTLCRAMQAGPKSVPQLAEATEMPAHEILWHLAAMKKYGLVVETGLDEADEYYLYGLPEEAKP